MMEIIIIADNMTGAADTGVKFLEMTGHSMKMVGLDHKFSQAAAQGLALHTLTRNESALAAKLAMDRAADFVRRLEPKIIYKKIDSCLRGHVGLELGALVRDLQFKGALVAPAYPTFGRVTREGLHYVGGVLVSESEAAADPIRPVTDSSLASIIGLDNDCLVRPLGLETIEKGAEAVAAAISEMLNSDRPVLIAADAVTDSHLDTLAEAGLRFKDRLILTGSAGLAGGLARLTGSQSALKFPESPLECPILYFGGSTAQILHSQLAALRDMGCVDLLTVDIEKLMKSGGELPLPARPTDGRHLAVALPPPVEGTPPTGEDFSRRLVTAFGRFAASVVRAMKPRTIFISGGGTAHAILSCLNLNELWLKSEFLPGMVCMEAGPIHVITKAGSFGSPDILVKLHQSLQ